MTGRNPGLCTMFPVPRYFFTNMSYPNVPNQFDLLDRTEDLHASQCLPQCILRFGWKWISILSWILWTRFLIPGTNPNTTGLPVRTAAPDRPPWQQPPLAVLKAVRHGSPKQVVSPRHSMYAIYAYIDPSNHPNVGIYTIHGASGSGESDTSNA